MILTDLVHKNRGVRVSYLPFGQGIPQTEYRKEVNIAPLRIITMPLKLMWNSSALVKQRLRVRTPLEAL